MPPRMGRHPRPSFPPVAPQVRQQAEQTIKQLSQQPQIISELAQRLQASPQPQVRPLALSPALHAWLAALLQHAIAYQLLAAHQLRVLLA